MRKHSPPRHQGTKAAGLVSLCLGGVLAAVLAAGQQQQPPAVKFQATANLVLVNVDARDRAGRPIQNLKATDFEVFEDGQPQKIAFFEYERLDAPPQALARPSATEPQAPQAAPAAPSPVRYKDRRLLVLYFDLSAMPVADQVRAIRAAIKFLTEQTTPADLIAVMSFSTRFQIVQEFTDDRARLLEAIRGLRVGEGAELAAEAAAGEEDEIAEDTGSAFTADETEFNIFNTDRKLSALESAVKLLAALPQKKALVYFSSGVGKTGVENQSQLRATVNAAVRGNVAFYPIDARGLMATAPAGDAARGSPRGAGVYSGAMQRQLQARFNDQQETLHTLAADTGGKALLDNNDLTLGIRQAQQHISSYYVLGYYGTNPAQDGRFRRIRVRLALQPAARLDYRSGYFAPKDFRQFTSADKERQLEEALLLGDPLTDLSLAVEINYFRLSRDRYFVPIALKLLGAQVGLTKKGANESAELDFVGQVRDGGGKMAGSVRDTIRATLPPDKAGQLGSRPLQYDTALTLRPGTYTLRFLARENATGKMGTFEARFTVPDLDAENTWLRLSSVVLAGQRERVAAAIGAAQTRAASPPGHPLVQDGLKLIPSVTRVFRKDQELFVYFEIYDSRAPVAATLSFFRGQSKAFESQPVRVAAAARPHVLAVQFRVPLARLAPGRYTCQVNVMDEQAEKFAFPRLPVVLLDAVKQ